MLKIVNTVGWVAAIAVASSLAVVMPAFAQTSLDAAAGVNVQGGFHNGANGGGAWRGGMPGGGIFGTVSAVSGNTLTVTSAGRMMRPVPMGQTSTSSTASAPVTYSVDASSATIYKGNASTTISVSGIAIGDSVMVQGTVSGTSVTATVIRDGFPRPMTPGGPMMPVGGRRFGNGSSTPSGTPAIQGNGEPVIGGKITAIVSSTLTVTNASNVTYTIDASNAAIVKGKATSTLASVAVGDTVIVQGAVNGNAVTASSVIDQGVAPTPGTASGNASSSVHGGFGLGAGIGGFFAGIGGFFQHLFGF